MRNRTIATLLAGAVTVGSLAVAAPAMAESPTQGGVVIRIAGENRILTAVGASMLFVDDKEGGSGSDNFADAVVLTRADTFADAAAGGPLAAAKGGPLLLTPSNRLDDAVAGEIGRILPAGKTVYLLGSTASLSAAVETAVQGLGYATVRLGGADRFETSVLIAKEIAKGGTAPSLLMLATGLNFPDALTAGAAAGANDGAVLLTAGEVLPKSVRDYLVSRADAEVYAIGKQAIAAYSVDNGHRIAGENRYETAVKIAEKFFTDPEGAALASGTNFPDALSISPLMALAGGPVLLTEPNALPKVIADYLVAGKASTQGVFVLGGEPSVSWNVMMRVSTLLAS